MFALLPYQPVVPRVNRLQTDLTELITARMLNYCSGSGNGRSIYFLCVVCIVVQGISQQFSLD